MTWDTEDVWVIVGFSPKFYVGIARPRAFALALLLKSVLTKLSTPQIATNGYLVPLLLQ